MVEKARTMARKLEIPQWKADGLLPSPTSPLDRASPRGWRHRDAVGGVGLGILAALEAEGPHARPAAGPVPRVSIPRRAARLEVSELGCSGHCATSLCGGGGGGRGCGPASARPGGVGGGAAFRVAEFLSCCDMCRRALDGKDIFMYRGERAFCSMECRYHAIVSDEFQEEKERKRRAAAAMSSAADVPKKTAAEMAGSPCSGGGQIFFTTGIVGSVF
ncbi:FCS-Like Zinc finger 13-like [Miscanthus floridulus]|uniref:FCS-Like Zinc finger 13-like n=1 Tax=Miscanthus floridulus TaxID=154761 RepID=UPI00345A4170